MTHHAKVRTFRILGVAVLSLFALLNSLDEIGMSGNEASRFATIQAVAEQGTFAIEGTNFRTVDKLLFDGHLYSDKPPFQSWIIGMLCRPLLRLCGLDFVNDYHLLVYLIDLLAGGGVNVLLFWWLFNAFRRLRRGSLEAKFLLALGCCAGTWLLSYSVVLNNHTPAALCLLGVFVALWKFARRPDWRAASLAGAGCGLLGALDIPGGVFFSLAMVPAVWQCAPEGRRMKFAAAAAGIVAAAAAGLLLLNWTAYSRILPLYISDHGSFSPGVDGKSAWAYAAECLFTYRGIFSYQPFLLLAPCGVWLARKKLAPFEWWLLGGSLVFAGFYIGLTNEFGGAAYGFRYLIPLIPLWFFYAGRFVLSVRRRRWLGALAAAMIIWGVVTALAGAYFPFCLANEGGRTPPGHFSWRIRSTFAGNLLCWSYEKFPKSPLTRELIRHYGADAALRHLHYSFFSMKRLDLLARLNRDAAVAVEKAPEQ